MCLCRIKPKAVLFGSLLGDGSLNKPSEYTNARFQMRHSEKQAEYFFWKANALKEIAAPYKRLQTKKDGYSENNKLRFSSKAIPSLNRVI